MPRLKVAVAEGPGLVKEKGESLYIGGGVLALILIIIVLILILR